MNKSIEEMSRARGALLIAALVAVLCAGTAYAQQANSNSTGSQKDTPDTPRLEFVFEEFVTLGASIHPGETPFGERNIVPITGGTFSGPNIRGKIMSGGWDWQLVTKTGCHSIQADYMISSRRRRSHQRRQHRDILREVPARTSGFSPRRPSKRRWVRTPG